MAIFSWNGFGYPMNIIQKDLFEEALSIFITIETICLIQTKHIKVSLREMYTIFHVNQNKLSLQAVGHSQIDRFFLRALNMVLCGELV